ncbi:dephospho-CoA kinase [Mitsuokella sp. WILCCON 0060]|uniref:dephospho-CoA kinase n=1 Tax=unclassified Mitsuokella TaxID=2637239 RepID=UPI003F066A4E
MKRIGLTGGIASGKSTAAAILRELGARVLDADAVAHELTASGQPLYEAYVRHFGPEAVFRDGRLDRRAIGRLVFSSPAEKRWLNETSHPLIRRALQEQMAQAEAEGLPAVVLDIPLLFESGWQNHLDEVWLVYVPENVQLTRLMARNGYGRTEAMNRIKAQLSIEEKRKRADIVIDNTGNTAELRQQLVKLWQQSAGEKREGEKGKHAAASI